MDEIFEFLNQKADEFNNPKFIESDPIQIPHRFENRQDIEIAGFLAATIAWGNRKSIVKDAEKMLNFMGNAPYDFIQNFSEKDFKPIENQSVHRTFNAADFKQFCYNLKKSYETHDSLEDLFLLKNGETDFYNSIERFRAEFLGAAATHRSAKHVSSTRKGSAAKRLMMFLRWMVRKDKKGVDFGIWRNIDQRYLSVPLDVHSGNIARRLGILQRKQNDWKAVEEMDKVLRIYKPADPAVYDFALFGLGAIDGWKLESN